MSLSAHHFFPFSFLFRRFFDWIRMGIVDLCGRSWWVYSGTAFNLYFLSYISWQWRFNAYILYIPLVIWHIITPHTTGTHAEQEGLVSRSISITLSMGGMIIFAIVIGKSVEDPSMPLLHDIYYYYYYYYYLVVYSIMFLTEWKGGIWLLLHVTFFLLYTTSYYYYYYRTNPCEHILSHNSYLWTLVIVVL